MTNLLFFPKAKESECAICGRVSETISSALQVCGNCIRTKPDEAKPYVDRAHRVSRKKFDLPGGPPNEKDGVKCRICVNSCQIAEERKGFCGLRTNHAGKLKHLAGTAGKGVLEWYYDPLPTNCVGGWVCPGGTGSGFPEFSYTNAEPEYGLKNLAVFYGACTFDCLFCQNWHYRRQSSSLAPVVTSKDLASKVDPETSCICYFGGDPTPQIMHAIKTSKLVLENNKNRILRICWESNGSMSKRYAKEIGELSLVSGGCVKFDLKTWDENLNIALCGVTNRQTLANFEYLSKFVEKRPNPPFLIASTLLVPGYVTANEVEKIAEFIASLNPEIPYSLLAFHPQFEMLDMPITPKKLALACLKAAKQKGLKQIKMGNIHLLV